MLVMESARDLTRLLIWPQYLNKQHLFSIKNLLVSLLPRHLEHSKEANTTKNREPKLRRHFQLG